MRYLTMLSALALTGGLGLMTACQTAVSQPQQQGQNSSQKKTSNAGDAPLVQNTPEEAKRISLEEAKAAYDKGGVVFVDTRDADSFKSEHIKGAINIPLPEFENRYQELPPNKQIIAYCS